MAAPQLNGNVAMMEGVSIGFNIRQEDASCNECNPSDVADGN